MARKTYRQRYMAVYKNLQKELQKPIYSGISEISIPKRIGRKQLERIQDISKQIKSTGKKIERLQSKGFVFDVAPIQLPTRLTRATARRVQEKTRPVDVIREARFVKQMQGIPEAGLEPWTLEKTGLEGLAYLRKRTAEKRAETIRTNKIVEEARLRAQEEWEVSEEYIRQSYNDYEWGFKEEMGRYPSEEEYEDYRDLYDTLGRQPTKAEFEAYTEEPSAIEEYDVDFETGEVIPKGTKEREFYEDNEYNALMGKTGEEPSEIDLVYNSLYTLLDLLDTFNPENVDIKNPMFVMGKYNLVQELKDDINRALQIGDPKEISENLEKNWSSVLDIVERLMYRIYSSDNDRYEPVYDYNRLLEIINGEE